MGFTAEDGFLWGPVGLLFSCAWVRGFWESSFHVGSGSERTAEAITLSSVGSAPFATGFNLSHPSSESHLVTELVRHGQGRENSKGSELEASPDPA